MLFISTSHAFSQDTLFFDTDWNSAQKDQAAYFRITKDTLNAKLFRDYYISGKLQMVGMTTTKMPLNNFGIVKSYYESGVLENIGNYVGDELTGLYVSYHPNGNKKLESKYKNGKIVGSLLSYHENGMLRNRLRFKNGLLGGSSTTYHDNGVLHRKGKYVNDETAGKWEFYSKSGDLNRVLNYQYELLIPNTKHKLRFTRNRWTQIDQAEDEGFERITYMGKSIKDKEGNSSVPPRIYVFVDGGGQGQPKEESYARLLAKMEVVESTPFHFPQQLPASFSDPRAFSRESDNIVYRWASVWYKSPSGKLLLVFYEVEEKLWEGQIKDFNEILTNIK